MQDDAKAVATVQLMTGGTQAVASWVTTGRVEPTVLTLNDED